MPPDLPSVGFEVDVAWWARRRDKVGVVEDPWMPRGVFLKFLKTRVTRRTCDRSQAARNGVAFERLYNTATANCPACNPNCCEYYRYREVGRILIEC